MPSRGLPSVEQPFSIDASGYRTGRDDILGYNRDIIASADAVMRKMDDLGYIRPPAAVDASMRQVQALIESHNKYVAVMAEAHVANDALNASHRELTRSMTETGASLKYLQDGYGKYAAAVDAAHEANDRMNVRQLNRDFADMIVTQRQVVAGTDRMAESADRAALSYSRSVSALRETIKAGETAAGQGETLAAAVAAGRIGGGGGFLSGTAGAIFGGALPTMRAVHMGTMLTMEVASQVIPAAVAAGAAAAVGYQGAQAAYTRGQAVYTAGEALGGTFGLTPGQLFGMPPGYQIAQNQATGGVYGIIGSLMRMAAGGTGYGSILGPGGTGVQTVAMIDRGLANMVGSGRMTQLNAALGGGTGALQTIGDIGGNLGDTLLNLAPVLPGMGGMLFGGLKTGTGVLRSITGLAGGGGVWPLLFGTGLAGEAGYRWGGTLLGGGKLPWFLGGGQFQGLSGLAQRFGMGTRALTLEQAAKAAGMSVADYSAMGGTAMSGTGLAGFLGGGLPGVAGGIGGIAALIAASAYGISQGTFGTPAAGTMGGYMRSINASFGATSLDPISRALFSAATTQGNIPGVSFENIGGQQAPVGVGIAQLMREGLTRPQALAQIQAEYAANTKGVSNQLVQMTQAGQATLTAMKSLGISGASLSDAFSYMTEAMISPKDVGPGGKLDATAKSQLASFVKAYQVMTGRSVIDAAGGRALGGVSVSALSSAAGADYVMASPQMKSLSQINQALDSMTAIMTGGPGNAAALYGLAAGAPAAVAAAAGGPGITGAGNALMARALRNIFTPGGAAAWTQFAGPQGIIAASQANMDQLRTFMTLGGLTGPQAAQLGAFELKQFAPMTAQSPMALAMLQQQAMQAGVPGVMMGQSYGATQRAINAHAGTAQQANALMTAGTRAVANIPSVANFLNPNANVSPLEQAMYAQLGNLLPGVIGHPTAANVRQLTGLIGMLPGGTGVSGKGMRVAVDGILQQLHVPGNLRVKIEGEIAPPKLPSVPKPPKVEWQSHLTAPHVPQVTPPTVIYHSKVIPPVPPVVHGIAIYTSVMTGGPAASVVGGGTSRIVAGQTGFKVPGFGGGDIIPAMLEPGELVVPKDMVAAGMVSHLQGKIPGFQTGGLVPDIAGVGAPFRVAMTQLAAGLVQYVGQALSQVHPQIISQVTGGPLPIGGGGGYMRPYAGSGGPVIQRPVPVVVVHDATGGGFGPVPHPSVAASKVFDAFEKTFKGMGTPWGKLASEILQGLIDGVKNAPHMTAKAAQALVSKVSAEIAYGKGLASQFTQGLNLGGMQVAPPTMTAQGQPYQYWIDQQSGQPLSVQQQMADYLQAEKSFGGDIGKLSKGRLNKAMLRQILAAGPVQGDALAQSILGGQGGIGAANSLYAQITKASTGLGVTGMEAVYGIPKALGQLHGKDVTAKATTAGLGAVNQLDAAIGKLHNKTVVLNVKLNIEGGSGGAQTMDQIVNEIMGGVQRKFLQQAKRNRKTGLTLSGYGS
jgi:hypothetical protein